MSTAARRRLMRDFKRLQEDPPMGVSGAPGENNIMIWNAVIFGICLLIVDIMYGRKDYLRQLKIIFTCLSFPFRAT